MHGQQTDLSFTEQGERVEIGAVPAEPPVQACAAVPAPGGKGADGIARTDPVAAGDVGVDRQIGGAQLSVQDADHTGPGHTPGEGHPAVPGGQHLLAGVGGQVHTAVAGQPAFGRRIERPDDPGLTGERPPPRPVVGRGRRLPDHGRRRKQQAEEEQEQQGRGHAARWTHAFESAERGSAPATRVSRLWIAALPSAATGAAAAEP